MTKQKCLAHDGMHYYEIEDNGDTINFIGVDMGRGMRPYKVHYRDANRESGDIIIIYVPGHSFYGGLMFGGKYERAKFHVLEKVCTIHVKPITTFPVRSQK